MKISNSLCAMLLYPPNWSACVSGPHLGLPLIAGAGRESDWEIETWDLSQQFYRSISNPPSCSALMTAAQRSDFTSLDDLYFSWEDQCSATIKQAKRQTSFGLLSGCDFAEFRRVSLFEISHLIRSGTPYTSFLIGQTLPALIKINPAVIGITIASEAQVIPALELLQLVRAVLPNSFLVLGGNVVTRLRRSSALQVLSSIVDRVVTFQGDLAIRQIMDTVKEVGVEAARRVLPIAISHELIPYHLWATPVFSGIDFGGYAGIPTMSYVSTRGCYWGKCHFCAIPAGWSTRGYGGSAPAEFVAKQLAQMVEESGIHRVKFVDEAIPPRKARDIATLVRQENLGIEWEAYARLETLWEDSSLLTQAQAGGLKKLYFGLEQAPTTNRSILGKNDRGNPMKILNACRDAGIKVHLFCMVGHPGSTRDDADATVRFLLENEALIDTADLVGFRLDRGTSVPGVEPGANVDSDWAMSVPFEPTLPGILSYQEVAELESLCQERLWESVPRLLHPLYRVISPWNASCDLQHPKESLTVEDTCLSSSFLTP